MARLNVLAGSRRGSVLDLKAESAVIGRSKECDLVLLDETISRRHARILGRSDGYYLEDLGSRNGTFLNGNAVSEPIRLAHNDCIQLFDVALAFDESETPDPTADPSSHVALRRRNRLAETVAQVDIPTFSSDWTSANAESKLQAVLELSRGLEDAIELDDVQTQLLDALYRILVRIDRACLFRVDDSGRAHLAALRGRDDPSDLSATIAPLTWDLVDEVMMEQRAILVSDARTGRSARDSVHTPAGLSAMCAPLMDMSQVPLGALYVETSQPENCFTHDDLDVLACVALLASRAVEQATLHSARYRAVVDHAADSIITLSDDGRIESSNPAVQRQLGFEPTELFGEFITRILPEFDREQLRTAPSAESEQAPYREIMAQRRDGSTFPASVTLGQFDLRGRHYFTAALRDITHQKQEEEHLQRLNEQLEEQVNRRTKLIRLQQDVAVIANEAESVQEAFCRVMRKVSGFLEWSIACACLSDVDDPDHFTAIDFPAPGSSLPSRIVDCSRGPAPSLIARVVLSGKPCWAPIATGDGNRAGDGDSSENGTALAFPVLLGRRVVGVLQFVSGDPGPPPATRLKVLSHVGTQLGRIVERHFLQQQLVDAVWRQQRQFGQELHDTLGQELTGIGMFAQALQQRLAAGDRNEADDQAELVAMIQQAKQTARELAKGLQPVEIDAFGLPAALEELARSMRKRTGIDCRFAGDPAVRFDDDEVATHLYRIAQEAVTNAVKHAEAHSIHISLAADSEKSCRMEIHDDGAGIRDDPEDRAGGMGIRIMKYRARSIGAELRITGANPGTTVACELTLRRS